MEMATTVEAVKSTHRVEIVPVTLQKHPNADSLSIVQVFGYQCIVRTSDWVGVRKAAYLPPDSVADVNRPEFNFLADQAKADGKARIKAKKLGGVVSFGLMVPVPDDTPLGEDWAERLGVEHFEPAIAGERDRKGTYLGGEEASAPSLHTVKYDVDAFRRYHHLFVPGELVIVTEKLDGASARYVYHDGKIHVGSRNLWKKEFPDYSHLTVASLVEKGMTEEKAQETLDRVHSKPKKKNLWWDVLERTPELQKFCRDNPGVVVHGEVYGNVNCIKYGLPDVNRFAAFDLMKDGRWLDGLEARQLAPDIPWVPMIFPTHAVVGLNEKDFMQKSSCHKYDFDTICRLAEGPTLVADAKPGVIREGVVIKPLNERYDPHVGRVNFKVVSATFLERYR